MARKSALDFIDSYVDDLMARNPGEVQGLMDLIDDLQSGKISKEENEAAKKAAAGRFRSGGVRR